MEGSINCQAFLKCRGGPQVKEKARSVAGGHREGAGKKSRTPAVQEPRSEARGRSPSQEMLLANTQLKFPAAELPLSLYCQEETLEPCRFEALVNLCISFVTAAKNHPGALPSLALPCRGGSPAKRSGPKEC